MPKAALSLHSLPHELWVQPSIPKLRPLSWKLKNTRHIRQVSDSPAPSSPGWAWPQEGLSAMWQPDLPLPPPNHSLLLGPSSGHDFQNLQDELSTVWHKGPELKPLQSRRKGHPLIPQGSKTAAAAAPSLLRTLVPGPLQPSECSLVALSACAPVLGAGKVALLPPLLDASY